MTRSSDPDTRPIGRHALGENVDTDGVRVHHAHKATCLSFDPPKPRPKVVLDFGTRPAVPRRRRPVDRERRERVLRRSASAAPDAHQPEVSPRFVGASGLMTDADGG